MDPEHSSLRPERFDITQQLNSDAPWIDVNLWVELPFWILVDNGAVSVTVNGHTLAITTQDDYFELHGVEIEIPSALWRIELPFGN